MHAVGELQALLDYLQKDLAQTSDIKAIHDRIRFELADSKVPGDGRPSVYSKPQDFRDNWRNARERNFRPNLHLLVEPWALAYAGPDGLRKARRMYQEMVDAEEWGRQAEARARQAAEHARGASEASRPRPISNEDLGAQLVRIQDILTAVDSRGDPLLVTAVLPRLSQLSREISPWADGVAELTDANYESVLVQAYQDARQIEATTVPEFLPRWEQPFGRQLIDAHVATGARTARVFVFESVTDAADEQARRIMFEHVLIGVLVLVFCRDDTRAVAPPPSRSWDFAMIDKGQRISETFFRGSDEVGANWYFGNRDATSDYIWFFERLRHNSTEYGKFMGKHAADRNLQAVLIDLARLLRADGQASAGQAVMGHVAALDDAVQDAGQHTKSVRSVLAMCTTGDVIPQGLFRSNEDAPSAASTYGYLRRQLQRTAQAELGGRSR